MNLSMTMMRGSRSLLSQIHILFLRQPASPRRRLTGLCSSVRGFSSFPRVRPTAVRPSSTVSPLHGQYGTTPRRSFVLRWYHHPRKVAAATAIALSATAAAVCSRYDRQIVPCTNRSHLVVYSHQEERDLGDSDFAMEMATFEILDPSDPQTVRARLVAQRIVHAAHRGLGIYDSDDAPMLRVTRKWGMPSAPPAPHTSHLRELSWEVFVAKNGTADVVIAPSGKILVSTGFLDMFTDDEIAAVLAHEVGHVIARHTADISGWFPVFLERIISRRMEIEADYIGILLLGAAGFHPQWALVALVKQEKVARVSVLRKFLSDHPKTQKRVQLLSEGNTMNEALELYREVTAMDKITDRYFPYHVKM